MTVIMNVPSNGNSGVLELVVAEIEKIAGTRLSSDDRLKIAHAAIKIIQDQNKAAAIAAVASAASVLEDPELNKPEDLMRKPIVGSISIGWLMMTGWLPWV